ncbi:hypothetical protein AVEN_209947-1 [Araneus ventricosus]|uniref:Uncharacterized protein n=1 Tax=Araneus ventricosus TaxID=182803 RepID=A0A4Y2DD54_ARAVE|nr:hypothetical protein AVEN_209947-1 [Araneus ventricosus]
MDINDGPVLNWHVYPFCGRQGQPAAARPLGLQNCSTTEIIFETCIFVVLNLICLLLHYQSSMIYEKSKRDAGLSCKIICPSPTQNPFTEQKIRTEEASLSYLRRNRAEVNTALAGTEPTERKKDALFNIFFFFSSLSHKLQSHWLFMSFGS